MEKKSAWSFYSEEQLKELETFAADYRVYLDDSKTERESVTEAVARAEKAGFADLKTLIAAHKPLKAGDRVYCNWMGKCILLFIVGERSMQDGMNILGAHIDSPRIDLKPNPLYEDNGLAYLDTHYYGYIKKYQWVARELALHGVVRLTDGRTITLKLGEKENDPVFYITDLLPHIADEQLKKPAATVIEGENLDLLIGNRPLEGAEKEPVLARVLETLKNDYGIEEEDFISAELEIVPATKTREVGFDRSMISGYGHDDRVCAYPSLRAILDYEGTPEYMLCCVLTDKEEIGSTGATGMRSVYFENIVAEMYDLAENGYNELGFRRALANSRMLSSDVSSAFDPLYAAAYERKNTAFMGHGVCFSKYTGSGGKGGSNDANAEYLGEIRRIMKDADVRYQLSEIGRVDLGGGGTIAYMCANYGMSVIDAGVPVLTMHAPVELISKADLYEAYRCYCAFLKNAKSIEY